MSKARAKAEREEQKRQYESYEPVFKLQAVGDTSVMCKYIGNIENKDKLTDEQITMDTPTGGLKLPDCGKYEIFGSAYACNVPGSYMLKNRKIPVFYVNLIYASQLVTGSLFRYFLYFTIDNDTAKSLILPKHYVNRRMTGKFSLELVENEGFTTYTVNKKRPQLEEEVMEQFVEEFDKCATENDNITLIQKIKSETEKKLDKYRKLFDPVEITGSFTRRKLILKMCDFFSKADFKEMIELCLEFTEDARRERMGSNLMKAPPKKVLNLKDFENDPSKIDEYVNNMCSDSSDESDESD